jgi:hypothetical protein
MRVMGLLARWAMLAKSVASDDLCACLPVRPSASSSTARSRVVEVGKKGVELLPELPLDRERRIAVRCPNPVARVPELPSVLLLLAVLRDLRDDSEHPPTAAITRPALPTKRATFTAPQGWNFTAKNLPTLWTT